jgi:alpha-mannosidase
MFSAFERICILGTTIFYAALSSASSAPASARGREVFRLGEFDGSSYEFAQGSPKNPVRVHPAAAGSTSGWYAFQPTVDRQTAGANCVSPTARVVAFSIAGASQPAYTVEVSLLFEHASVPALCVAVNGHGGQFYASPQRDNRMGDGGAVSFPAYSHATVSFTVPGRYLHAGENEIAFTAVSDDGARQVADAGFNYDAIAMREGVEEIAVPAMRLEPTIFFRKGKSALEEGIDATIRADGSPVRKASLAMGGTRIQLPLRSGVDWGEQKFRLFFPAFDAPTQARIEIDRGHGTEQNQADLAPAKRWTLFIVPHVHFDLGYTDYQAKVESVQSRVIDEALDLFAIHPEFRFSLDGFWSMEQFLNTRSASDKQRAMAALKAGKLFVPAQYSNELTGFASAETLFRSLYPSARFDAQHGLPLNYANITDVPSFSWSYASVLSAAGIHELAAGSNNGRAPILLRGHLDENSPFLWEGPDGNKVLMWYSRHYHQMWMLFGLPPLVSAGEQMLPLFLQMYGRPAYKANSALVYGSQVENTDLFPEQAGLVEEWNRQYAYPHLEYSGFHEALSAIAGEFHGDLPTVRGDGGPWWEDGIAADAYFAAMERETEARAPSAEKLATISSLQNPRIAIDKDSLQALWNEAVLMDEHTWLSAASFSDSENDEATVQLAFKDAHAQAAHLQTDTLMRRSMADLADSINAGPNNLIVFNTLNWPRSGMVSVDLPKGSELVDNATGKVVPTDCADHGEYTERVTFRAEEIPAVGYRTYSIRPGAKNPPAAALPLENTIENSFYRVQLDPDTGSIRSIFDKEINREMVDAESPYRFGQYLYVTTDSSDPKKPQFVVHGSAAGKLVSVSSTVDGVTAHLESSALFTPAIRTTITLSKQEKRIVITQDIEKKESKGDEAVYFAFPLAMKSPQFTYEIQNGVVDPARDMLKGAGLDWFSVQHWTAAQKDGLSVAIMPLDAPLVTFGDISRQSFPESFGPQTGTIFSYAMNNYWHTNYRAAQGGHFQFRYVITSDAKNDAAELSRRGWEEATPLEVDEVTAPDKAVETRRPLDGVKTSFLDANDPALVLEAWKPAEDGRGTILRFLDLGGEARRVHVKFPQLTIENAWTDDALERDQAPAAVAADGGVDLDIRPHAFLTLRIVNRVTEPPACGRFCGMTP